MSVTDRLNEALQIVKEREAIYGESGHDVTGKVMEILFPDGIHLRTAEQHVHYQLFVDTLRKLVRYSKNFQKGGHRDSSFDCGVYALILTDFDDKLREKQK